MLKMLDNISEPVKGILLMVFGFVLMLHTLGILRPLLWYALIFVSLYLIVVGFIKVGGVDRAKELIKSKECKQEEPEKKGSDSRILPFFRSGKR